jgi:hypothetical protein
MQDRGGGTFDTVLYYTVVFCLPFGAGMIFLRSGYKPIQE